jgi:hypothetical protein
VDKEFGLHAMEKGVERLSMGRRASAVSSLAKVKHTALTAAGNSLMLFDPHSHTCILRREDSSTKHYDLSLTFRMPFGSETFRIPGCLFYDASCSGNKKAMHTSR